MITRKIGAWCGLSTDPKPTEGVENAVVFYEMDTGNVFMFDEENKQWIPQ